MDDGGHVNYRRPIGKYSELTFTDGSGQCLAKFLELSYVCLEKSIDICCFFLKGAFEALVCENKV